MDGAVTGAFSGLSSHYVSKLTDFTYYKVINKNTIFDDFFSHPKVLFVSIDRPESSYLIFSKEVIGNIISTQASDSAQSILDRIKQGHKNEN